MARPSVSRFHVKDEQLLALLSDLGIEEPTEIQEAAIPEIMKGGDVLVIAPTGIGKTEAAILPIIERIKLDKPKGIACLYITPLRALNRDMMKRLLEFGKRLDVTIGVRHGDTPQSERLKQSKSPPQILITTPETFQILFLGTRLRSYLKNVRWVVIDEIHELAEDERGAQLAVGLERLAAFAGNFQRIGLSATVGDPEIIGRYLGGTAREVKVVRVKTVKEIDLAVESPRPSKEDAKQAVVLHTDDKHIACMRRARELIEQHRSTLFFVNTRDTAEALGVRYHLWGEGFKIGVHHGSLSKDVRIHMEEDFKNETLKALICTSSLELGIDVGSADFTLQFNSPRQVTRIIQRVGRSGHRIGRKSAGRVLSTEFTQIAESTVICRRAMKGELEHIRIRKCPLTVLANQIAAMCMTSGEIDQEFAFKTVKRTLPFADLDREDFRRAVSGLIETRMISVDGAHMRKNARTMKYFYDNISMIPDEKTYRIREISTRNIIGTLDESFVVASAEPYSTFVTRGRTWQVVEVKEDEVLVEEVRELAGTPSWLGEEIPVPFEVAQEVAAMRNLEDFSGYPMAADAEKEFRDFLEKQRDGLFHMPSSDDVLIEKGDKLLVAHACFGTKVNETLSRLIGSLVSAKLGESVALDSNPYAIILKTPMNIDPKEVERVLRETDPEKLDSLMRVILKSSSALKWQFLHVAKKFGAIEKGADYHSVNLSRIMDAFEGSVLMDEAFDKAVFDQLDIAGTSEVLRGIRGGKITVSFGKLSPLGTSLIGERKELMQPRTADRTILMALKNRLLEEQVILHCLKCGTERRSPVRSLPSKISCNACGGVMLAVIRPYAKDEAKAIGKRHQTNEEKEAVKRLYKTASLVMAHGRKAVLALVARGVGPDTAARLLQRYHLKEEEFLRDLLAAEVLYARTKRFWD
jgi:ATP-dependent Lhr-like helicase